MAPSPDISVVVATHGRPNGISRLLDSLAAQSMSLDRFETVVVDDGSSPPVAERLGALDERLSVRVIRHDTSRGPAAARNTGWRAATAPVVAFTDDDCTADPDWLAGVLHNAADDVIVQGKTVADLADGEFLGPFSRTQVVRGPDHLFETCNIAYPRSLLERVGGFDERFRNPCGEDVDLGWRAKKASGKLTFAPEAVVRHAVTQPSLARILRRTLIWHDAVRVLKLHPELRGMLVARLFWKPSHPPLLALLVGLMVGYLMRRPWLVALAPMPYLIFNRRRYRGRSWQVAANALPIHLAIDAAEVGVMMVGSVRHRTLML